MSISDQPRPLRLIFLLLVSACSGTVGNADEVPEGPAGTGGAPGAKVGLPGPELAASSRLRRLTVDEYDRTVAQLLGDPESAKRDNLPEDLRKPFDNDYTFQSVDSSLIGGAELLARDIAARLLADKPRRDRVVGCTPAAATGADASKCLEQFVTRFARQAWHRSLTAEQIGTLTALGQKLAQKDNNFYSGVDAVVQAVLQDTEFLYRVEVGAPVGGKPGLFKLTGPEMATRLSFFLWGSAPDPALLDLAEAGGLDGGDQVRVQAGKMLAGPAALARIARFHALWMGYERLPASPLAAAMKVETDSLMARVIFEQKLPWQQLLRSPETFVTYDLAVHYGITPPAALKKGSTQAAWVPYTGEGPTRRQGLLSHATFLQLGTKQADTHPVLRGKGVRELLFCQEIKKPDDVDTTKPAMLATSPCKPEFLGAHASGKCAGCHVGLDRVGFGLESYDDQGKFRATEYRKFTDNTKKSTMPVQSGDAGAIRCDITGDGELDGQKFNGPAELANLMLASPQLDGCAVKQLYRFAMGRFQIDDVDAQFLDLMAKRLGGADFRFDELLLDFVSSGAFAHLRVEN